MMHIKSLILMLSVFLISISAFSQEYDAKKSDATIQENGKKYYVHTVEKGNTLYNISKAYHVSTHDIESLNPDLKIGLKVGMELKIPFHTPQSEDYIYHIVKKKETLYQIAKIYNVQVEDITSINEIADGNISVGQYLKIPSIFVNATQANLHTEAKEQSDQLKIDDGKYKVYKVQPKETLFTIGKRFGISVDALMYLNEMESSNISEGQALLVPKSFVSSEEGFDSEKFIKHKVKPKETLYGIARKYATSVDKILENNSIENQQIQIGQELLIPRQLNTTGFITHEVSERRDKLSKVAGKYNVSVSEIKAVNPDASEKLKKGESLLIPVGFVETDFEVEEEEKAETQEKPKEIIYFSKCQKQAEQEKRYQIAIMLPLYLNEVDSLLTLDSLEVLNHKFDKPFKFLEFYEGALLAAKQMDSLGFEFDFHVYDIPREVSEATEVLNKSELQNMDLIISLVYSQSFEMISKFSKLHQIPLVNVLSKRRKVIYDNPYVFKVEPNAEALVQQAIDYVLAEHRNDNIIIIRSNPYQLSSEYKMLEEGIKTQIPYLASVPNADILGKISKKEMEYHESEVDFADLMTLELRNQLPGFDYDRLQAFPDDTIQLPNHLKTVIYSQDSLNGIINASSLFRNNLVLALGSEEVFAIELFTKLNFVRDSFNYEVIGMPDWFEYNSLDVAYSQPLKLKVFHNRFVDYAEPETHDFVMAFREEFGIEPQISRYAFLGYDVAKYFMTALQDFGKGFTDCLDEVDAELLENELEFRKFPDAGYENMHWNMLLQQDYQYYIID